MIIKYEGSGSPVNNAAESGLSASQHKRLEQITARIHGRHKRHIEAIIDTGKDVLTAKKILPHGPS